MQFDIHLHMYKYVCTRCDTYHVELGMLKKYLAVIYIVRTVLLKISEKLLQCYSLNSFMVYVCCS